MVDSPILGIPQVAPNQNNKETTINDGISIIERSLNDVFVQSIALDTTISATNFRRHQVLHITPTVGSLILFVPVQKRFFAVYNPSGTHSFIIRRTGDTTGGVTVPAGSYVICYQDGTNPIIKVADSASAAFVNSFITLSDAPASYTGEEGKLVRVNAAENALEFWTLDQSVLQLNDTPDVYTPLQYLRVNAAGTGFQYVSANPGGETEFILLTDVPLNYTGAGGHFVKVKGTADGLEFVSGTGLFDFTDLGDVPASYSGEAGRLIRVNATADALEFVDYPTFGNQITLTLTTANDGFEAGLVAPWDNEDPAELLYYTVESDIGGFSPGQGALSLLVDTSVTSTDVSYILDLTLYAEPAALDNSARLTLPYMFIDTLSNGTVGTVLVEFLSAALAVISSVSSGSISAVGVWTSGSIVSVIPSGTRSVRFTLTTNGGGDPILAGWDNLVAQLRITENVSFIDLPDTPSAYTGQANKVLKVSGASDAVIFGSVAATEISGMPASLAGGSGQALVVNPAGTAYILEEIVPDYDNDEALKYLRVAADGGSLEWVTVPSVTDGDKGDIVVSAGGTAWAIEAKAVTLGKIEDIPVQTMLGNVGGSAASPAALTPTQIKTLIGIVPTDVTGLSEAVDDRVAALLVAGANITINYDDVLNTLTIAGSGGGGGGGTTNLSYDAGTRVIASDTGTDATLPLVASGAAGLAPASGGGTLKFLRADATWEAPSECIMLAVGDETTPATAGAAKLTFRMPYAFTITAVRASLKTAQASGSIFTVDINEAGASILSTKLTIDNTEKTSVTAATPPVLSDTDIADDAEITIDIDQVGNGTAVGLKVTLIGVRA